MTYLAMENKIVILYICYNRIRNCKPISKLVNWFQNRSTSFEMGQWMKTHSLINAEMVKLHAAGQYSSLNNEW